MGKRNGTLEKVVTNSTAIDYSFWSNKRVLVTGHTGFKGDWLSVWLSKMGAKVFGVSLPPMSARELIQGCMYS
jgi:CDP-glucose 4,6-dehydratase